MSVNLADLTQYNDRAPVGNYVGRLLSVEPAKSKAGNDMVVAVWTITEGEYNGTDTTIWYPLVISEYKDKKGVNRKTCGGVTEMVRAFASIGEQYPQQFPTTAPEAAKLYASKMRGKTCNLVVSEQKPKEGQEKGFTRTTIKGLAGGSKATPVESFGNAAQPSGDGPAEYGN